MRAIVPLLLVAIVHARWFKRKTSTVYLNGAWPGSFPTPAVQLGGGYYANGAYANMGGMVTQTVGYDGSLRAAAADGVAALLQRISAAGDAPTRTVTAVRTAVRTSVSIVTVPSAVAVPTPVMPDTGYAWPANGSPNGLSNGSLMPLALDPATGQLVAQAVSNGAPQPQAGSRAEALRSAAQAAHMSISLARAAIEASLRSVLDGAVTATTLVTDTAVLTETTLVTSTAVVAAPAPVPVTSAAPTATVLVQPVSEETAERILRQQDGGALQGYGRPEAQTPCGYENSDTYSVDVSAGQFAQPNMDSRPGAYRVTNCKVKRRKNWFRRCGRRRTRCRCGRTHRRAKCDLVPLY